ncbi:hypothetical protein LNV09_24145 [Paucibacter sp. B2R-40]|uniref:hypothetical protein n=1 Tax=Paucibacter sp. B2R-40 TaxID=2893554 RepID=UPI0021E38124|nr:hypothetical protein [Paucibacter sp. B2R-40]MCV2357248.1 hypothetical protein [Paucibacter sp. B2R-40]
MNLHLTLRDIPRFPPPWSYACAGRPDERRGRIALRRAFVELKLSFLRAAADVPGEIGSHLQTLVRQASEPIELWLLHTSLLAAMPCELDHELGRAQQHRHSLSTALAVNCPDSKPLDSPSARR